MINGSLPFQYVTFSNNFWAHSKPCTFLSNVLLSGLCKSLIRHDSNPWYCWVNQQYLSILLMSYFAALCNALHDLSRCCLNWHCLPVSHNSCCCYEGKRWRQERKSESCENVFYVLLPEKRNAQLALEYKKAGLGVNNGAEHGLQSKWSGWHEM